VAGESIDRLRAVFEAFSRTQRIDPEAVHPEIEWHVRADLPDSGTYRGYEEVERWAAGWAHAFEDLRTDLSEITEVDGRIVVDVHMHGRVRGSGEEVHMDEIWVLTERDGRLIEIREYNTREEALGSLGIVGSEAGDAATAGS